VFSGLEDMLLLKIPAKQNESQKSKIKNKNDRLKCKDFSNFLSRIGAFPP
jgi:hypothetical protein